jgi:hypothetical protein
MRVINLKKLSVIEYLWAFIGTVVAILICLPISNDGEAYSNLFSDLPLDSSAFDISITSEYFFWGWLQWVKSIGGSLPVALIPIIFFTLLFKLKAFKHFGGNTFYLYLTYACTFYLLNEGTQLRISAALGFALLSCVAIKERKWMMALILCIASFGFHITSLLLPLVFFVCYKNRRIQKLSWLFLFSGILAFLTNLSIVDNVVLPVAGLLGGRYLDYISSARLETQNSSGLAFVYAFVLCSVVVFLYYWAKFNPSRRTYLFNTCLSVCVYGNGLLFWLYTTVAVAARLSDILTILIIPLLATAISTSQRAFQCIAILILGLFVLMRMQQLYHINFLL